eukprot:EG_transcript_27537
MDQKVEEDYTSSEEEDDVPSFQPAAVSPSAFEESRKEQGTGYDELARQDDLLLGKKCIIIFKLPDGNEHLHNEFRMGHTVDWLKRVVEEKYHIPYHSHKLLFNGKLMIDPLSLSDIPGISPEAENHVEVKEG